MLMQRLLCHSWQPRIGDASARRILHHVGTSQRKSLLRSFRSSGRHQSNSLQVTPLGGGPQRGPVPTGNVVKALIFTGAFTGGCFMGATIMEYENARNMMIRKAKQGPFPWLQSKQNDDIAYWQNVKQELGTLWDQLTPGQRVFAPLCALNLIVFGMWRVPALRSTMMTYFCSNPAARAVCWPMFLSTFSHYSAFHIFANMYVLHSFANASVLSLGKEQFLAVYLSGGVIASLSSILYKTMTAQAGLSIGASGAIMAILAYVCSRYPDTQLSILFLPMVTFSAGTAIKVIMGIDLAGCLMGWKLFDHAAHLGGALFGIFWAYYGTELWQRRVLFLNHYHDWRRTK